SRRGARGCPSPPTPRRASETWRSSTRSIAPRGFRHACPPRRRLPPPGGSGMRRSIEDSEPMRRVTDAAPRVSVVIPVFNAGRDLEHALASVAAQTFTDHEVVVVDDGSTDALTRTILDDAAARGAIALHRVPNGGPARARNLGIEHARAAYILPLDADDRLAPTFLARTVPVLDAEPHVGVVYTWARLTGAHHGVWRTGGFSVAEL